MLRLTILPTLVTATICASAQTQHSFNIDVNHFPGVTTVPSAQYGGAANSPGLWYDLDVLDIVGAAPTYTTPGLPNIAGQPTGVTITFDPVGGLFFGLFGAAAGATGDDLSLLNDGYWRNGFHTATFNGLDAGRYEIYCYAYDPTAASYRTSVTVVGSSDPTQIVGGSFGTGHALGVTYSLHHVTVTSAGTIEVQFDVAQQVDCVTGFQLVRTDPPGLLGWPICEPAVANSTGFPARLDITGSDLVASNNMTLTCVGLPPTSFAFFLASRSSTFVANPGGSYGNLCLGAPVGRGVGGAILNSGPSGVASIAADLSAMPQPTGPVAVTAGETWYFQCWYRDSLLGTVGSNLSQGQAIHFR